MALSRAARQALVQQLIEANAVSSQTELAELLAGQGVTVTQGTISKDLVELGAVRRRDSSGALRYVIPDDTEITSEQAHLAKLAKLCTEMLLDAQASANLVVARTPPGAAQYFASIIDKASPEGIMGTIAGDDTVLIITSDPQGGEAIAQTLLNHAAGRRPA